MFYLYFIDVVCLPNDNIIAIKFTIFLNAYTFLFIGYDNTVVHFHGITASQSYLPTIVEIGN